jgi:RNA-directed DNA polymerase
MSTHRAYRKSPTGNPPPTVGAPVLDPTCEGLRVRFPRATRLIITGSSYARWDQEGKPLVEQFLHARGRELAPQKTRLTPSEDGFAFLGQHLRKYAGKLMRKPARKNVKAFLRRVREIVKANTQATAGNLIAQRNPGLRGGANYHRHAVSKATVVAMATARVKILWTWATRRHPQQAGRWRAANYFRTRNGRRWTFVGTRVGPQGQPLDLTLGRAGAVPIPRHINITGAAHPEDSPGEGYCEERRGVKLAHARKGRRQRLSLWTQQAGRGPVCHQQSTRLTGWQNHHRLWRPPGGSDTAAHRGLRHPHWHRQGHSRALDEAPPRATSSVGKAGAACRDTCTSSSEGAWRE